jgi:hypothetical protein
LARWSGSRATQDPALALSGERQAGADVFAEIDGSMLQHGLQGFQGRRIHVPRADHLEPNRDFLAERYALFRRAS